MFFGLLVGFLVYITLRGELSAYLSVVGIGPTLGRQQGIALNDSLAPIGSQGVYSPSMPPGWKPGMPTIPSLPR
jgi:hypothetical protein